MVFEQNVSKFGGLCTKWLQWLNKKCGLRFQVGAMIGNLRNMANDMNGELNNQNQQLERINKKAESDNLRVKMANDKAAALMK